MKEPSLIILEDTREQDYLTFTRFKHVEFQQSQCLPVGDYACVINGGSLSSVVFERKSKADLWGTLGPISKAEKERRRKENIPVEEPIDRFSREFYKSKSLGIKLVLIIECSEKSIFTGMRNPATRFPFAFNGKRMYKRLKDMESGEKDGFEGGIEIVFCNGRKDMENYMYERWCAEARLALKTGA